MYKKFKRLRARRRMGKSLRRIGLTKAQTKSFLDYFDSDLSELP